MNTKQVVAIIGALGEMGSAIAKSISKGNYRIILQSPDTVKTQLLINQIKSRYPLADIEAVESPLGACWEADIIIAAAPYPAEKEIAERIRKFTNQKVVISISNPLNRGFEGSSAPNRSAAEELQTHLPYAKVVKAFNTTFADDFNHPVINGQQLDCFIAGNDEEALEVVSDLVKTAGFNPVVAGNLSVSRTLENMQLLLIHLTMQHKYNWIAGWKILHYNPNNKTTIHQPQKI
jgi:8-hydroxy-5-deazaflavin:NADPH oxidoreductase